MIAVGAQWELPRAVARLDIGLSPLRPYRLRLPAFAAILTWVILAVAVRFESGHAKTPPAP
jgi:hypothetical protein